MTKKLHYIFWISVPFIILTGLLRHGISVDINFYDTYYIIDFPLITYVISMVFFIIGLGYWVLLKAKRTVSKTLMFYHIIITFGGILLILNLSQFYQTSFQGFEFNNNLNLVIYLLCGMVILSQIIFLINIARGLIIKSEINSGSN